MSRTRLMKRLSRLLNIAMIQEKHQLRDETLADAMEWSQEQVTRRRFLSNAGLAGLALPTAIACQTPASTSLESTPTTRDVVIVGGGTAGLTAAYHLAKAGIGSSIYEGSSRLGGRMFTAERFNSEGMFCELGGEFVDTQHEDIIQLCQELGLPVDDLMTDARLPLREIFFSRGTVRSEKQVIAAFKPLAKKILKDSQPLIEEGEVSVPTYSSALAQSPLVQALDRMNLSEYLAAAKIDAWLLDLISNAYVGEYGLEAAEQSALNLIVLVDPNTKDGFKVFGDSDEAKRIRGGSEALPKALAKAIRSAVPIEYEHRLLAVHDSGTDFTLTFDRSGTSVTVKARRVILAIPPPLLKEVDMKTLALSPVKKRAIAEWGFGTNSKLMLGFQKRVWEKPEGLRGFSILPDQLAQEFWDTSRGQAGASGIITCFLGGERGRVIAPTQQIQSLDFLDRIFPGTKTAFDGQRMLMHWSSQNLARGSYTCSQPGQYTTIYGAFAEAELDRRLVFAGEHCSADWSGYMNGAVHSGKQAVDLLLGRVTQEPAPVKG